MKRAAAAPWRRSPARSRAILQPITMSFFDQLSSQFNEGLSQLAEQAKEIERSVDKTLGRARRASRRPRMTQPLMMARLAGGALARQRARRQPRPPLFRPVPCLRRSSACASEGTERHCRRQRPHAPCAG